MLINLVFLRGSKQTNTRLPRTRHSDWFVLILGLGLVLPEEGISNNLAVKLKDFIFFITWEEKLKIY